MRRKPAQPESSVTFPSAVGRPEVRERAATIRNTIRSIPRGKVATYGEVAAAAGLPNGARQVAQVLRKYGDSLPWHRVLGAGGRIKLSGEHALDQRLRLEMEGVRFRGVRVDLAAYGNFAAASERPKKPRRRT